MHPKRRRPKNRRSGCLMCKPHKGNGCGCAGRSDGLNMRNLRRRQHAIDELRMSQEHA